MSADTKSLMDMAYEERSDLAALQTKASDLPRYALTQGGLLAVVLVLLWSYHDTGAAMIGEGDAETAAWLICDHPTIRKYGLGYAKPAPVPISIAFGSADDDRRLFATAVGSRWQARQGSLKRILAPGPRS